MALWARRVGRWDASDGSERDWTRTLIPSLLLDRWVNQSYEETMFQLTQLLTGHGCFNRYLNRISCATASRCFLCGPPDSYSEEDDDAFHTLISCEAFERTRDELCLVIGSFWPRELVARMLESPSNWDSGIHFAESVMRSKEEAECGRQSLQGIAPSRRGRRLRVTDVL